MNKFLWRRRLHRPRHPACRRPQPEPRDVPSPLVGKPAANFSLPVLGVDRKFGPEDMKGKVWMLNVWASWCVSCRAEHPILVELGRKNIVPVVGLNYKGKSVATARPT